MPPPPGRSGGSSRSYRLFKNPPQPHMCIQDSIKGTAEKLYINVMSWKQIGNARQLPDLIPLYGGMQILHGCNPNCTRPPLIVFAVMVNPEVLKVNGKYAPNPHERDALVSLSCDFVEAMNPGLQLARRPVILKDRDLAGELKDVWHAVQQQRERERLRSQEANGEVTHKVYHIDGPTATEAEGCAQSQNRVEEASNADEAKIRLDNKQLSYDDFDAAASKRNPEIFAQESLDSIRDLLLSNGHMSQEKKPPVTAVADLPDSGGKISQAHESCSAQNKSKKKVSVKENDANRKNLAQEFPKMNPDSIGKPLQSSNQVIAITSKSSVSVLDDDKDIPYVDDYHEDGRTTTTSVEEMFQNLKVNNSSNLQARDASLLKDPFF